MRFKNIILTASLFAALILILLCKTNPGIFTAKAKGSFEYVRQGEALLDKGRYKDAIAEFEKAFEASGENKDIASYLVWAYSKYAMVLADSNDYNSAIDHLARAYNVKADKDTAQNLAIMHSKKALAELGKGSFPRAIEEYALAREIASDFTGASKSLGISIFNDAVGEYKASREKQALLLLKESALACENSRVYEFTGDIYYKRTELEKALFYWDEAKRLEPENKSLAEKLEKVKKEMALELAQEKEMLAHFEIRYDKSLPVDIRLVSRILDKAYNEVGRDLKYFPAKETAVFLYSESDFRRIFKLPSVIRAFYDGNIRMPFPENNPDAKGLEHYLFHEYTHAVVSAVTNNNCPVWFGEGLAMWEEYRGDDSLIRELLPKAMSGIELSMASLSEAFKAGAMERDLRPYYLLSYTAVKYIIEKWGLDGLRDILKRLAGGQHVVNAIDDEFLLSEKEFNKRWGEYVRENHLQVTAGFQADR